jgi:hypothetical protein
MTGGVWVHLQIKSGRKVAVSTNEVLTATLTSLKTRSINVGGLTLEPQDASAPDDHRYIGGPVVRMVPGGLSAIADHEDDVHRMREALEAEGFTAIEIPAHAQDIVDEPGSLL